tara:strand:- start:603 stop:1127 length:525 start_codon:yes stop_codon:yes gene_type:complete
MSCTARSTTNLFATEVHIFGYDCAAFWMFPTLIVVTVMLKVVQNKIWAELGQAQRVAMQFSKQCRGPYVWTIVRMEAFSTTLGLISIILILGSNLWVWLAIVVGNLVGVYRTYSKLTKDSHSTAHDLVEMLERHKYKYNANTAEFILRLQDALAKPQVQGVANPQGENWKEMVF